MRTYDEAVGMQLKLAKTRARLTNAEIAERSGISYETFKRYFDGSRTTPMDALVRLARVFGMTPADLLTLAEADLAAADDPPLLAPGVAPARELDRLRRTRKGRPDASTVAK